jgi:peptidoglycan/LPS O-acetylase OafA/YrhL
MRQISENTSTSEDVVAPIYYPWFDWLRALCAVTVVLYHDHAISWTHSGDFAVQVFFALSGWLIGGMLLKMNTIDLPRFFFNRALRIWGPYYIAVSLLLLLSVMRETVTDKWLEIVFYKLTFVYNLFGTRQLTQYVDLMPQKGTLSHVWSVNTEEQFYLVTPLILVLLPNRMGRSVAMWCSIAVVTYYLNSYAAIVLGVLAAVVVRRRGNVHLTPTGRLSVAMACVISGVATCSDSLYMAASPFAAIFIVLMLAKPGPRHKFGELFGGMSYPLYLNHWIGVFAFNYLMPSMREQPIRHALSIVANITVAMALYWWIEKPLLANRMMWFTRTRGNLITVAAYAMVAIGVTYGLWKMFL